MLTGAAALFESLSVFSEALHIWQLCKTPLFLGSALFGAWGVACYVGLILLKTDPIHLQIGGHPPADVALSLSAFVLAQALRVEAPRTTEMSGAHQTPGDRESYYGKGLRMLEVVIYRRLVDRMPDNEVRLLCRRGLVAAYDPSAMLGEYRTWALNLTDRVRSQRLLDWSRSVFEAKLRADSQKVDSLVQSLILGDLPMAKTLAKRRAPTIVYHRAL